MSVENSFEVDNKNWFMLLSAHSAMNLKNGLMSPLFANSKVR